MPELQDLIADVPEEILTGGAADDDAADTNAAGTDADDTADADADDNSDADADADTADADNADEDADADDDDYITSADEEDDEEEDSKPPAATKTPPAAPPATDENTFILNGLQKIAVRIVVPGKEEGQTEVKEIQVYGYGDLPRDYLGFATKYEEGVFTQAVNAQEVRARELQTQYRQQKIQSDMNDYTRRENQAIADDLTELRQEGIFPKFKGKPGTKEFNDSEGAKMFDKVVAYQNKMNRQYQEAANSGKSFRHIGFREAFIMLNGPNPKAADKADTKTRRAAAARLKGGRGTDAGQRTLKTEPVQNFGDLVDEFNEFAGAGSAS